MLPKPEKKTSIPPKVVESPPKIENKRSLIGSILFSTAFLSLFFWIYRSFNQFEFKFPNISLPKTSSTINFSPLDKSIRSVYVSKNDDIRQLGKDYDFADKLSRLNHLPTIDKLSITGLPQGLKYQEINQDDFYAVKVETLHDTTIIVIIPEITITSLAPEQLSNIVSQYYWQINSR